MTSGTENTDNSRKQRILLVDDDEAVLASLGVLLRKAGYLYEVAANPRQALDHIRQRNFNAAVIDMNYSLDTSGEEGMELLQKIKIFCPDLPLILISAWGSIELAVRGMRLGAFSFITKPWNNEALLGTLEAALAMNPVNESPVSHRGELSARWEFDDIIGESPQLTRVLQIIGRIAPTDASVLICGESGTGKELIAEAIHRNSQRNKGAFVKVNLGGISGSLFESEMFGHRKGAFTDAYTDRVGRFELARGGTIFLDEIAELDAACQVKLLRILQERTYEVLGDSQTRQADVRVVCATNRNLKQMVERGLFREDLFYRINVISVELPPLRERPGDIPILARHFAGKLSNSQQLPLPQLAPEVIKWLKELPYPGNIRELKNLVERVLLVSGKENPDLADFTGQYQAAPLSAHTNPLDVPGMLTLEQMEKLMIEKTLKTCNHNIAKVARSLGLSRGALYRRMEKHNIPYESEN